LESLSKSSVANVEAITSKIESNDRLSGQAWMGEPIGKINTLISEKIAGRMSTYAWWRLTYKGFYERLWKTSRQESLAYGIESEGVKFATEVWMSKTVLIEAYKRLYHDLGFRPHAFMFCLVETAQGLRLESWKLPFTERDKIAEFNVKQGIDSRKYEAPMFVMTGEMFKVIKKRLDEIHRKRKFPDYPPCQWDEEGNLLWDGQVVGQGIKL
jgi:hypothetical protein